MFGPKKLPEIPGFTPINDQVLVRHVPGTEPVPDGHPSVVIIYGWGDCRPKHVAKFCDGFQHLYPRSKQIVVLASIAKTVFHGPSTRATHMLPVLEALGDLILMPNGEGAGSSTESTEKHHSLDGTTLHSNARTLMEQSATSDFDHSAAGSKPSILVHAMSSTGMCNHASTLCAYQKKYNRPFPHQLLIADSTPGSPDLNHRNLKCWSRAMTVGTAKFLPWPAALTHLIFYLLLWLHVGWLWMIRQDGVGMYTVTAIDDETRQTKAAKRLFMYSKDDDLIVAEDIEALSEETRLKGYTIRREVFHGSQHVRHMQKFPEQYWRAVSEAWDWSLQGEDLAKGQEFLFRRKEVGSGGQPRVH